MIGFAGLVPWSWLEDRVRKPTFWRGWSDPDAFIEEQLDGVERAYYRDVWQDQPRYVEVACEKDALVEIFKSVVARYSVPLRIGRGYDSWSAIKRAADSYLHREREHGKPTTVLYFGDFDPSGEDMHRSLIERLGMLGAHPDVPKIALTHEDARHLPANFTKAGDSRREAFIAGRSWTVGIQRSTSQQRLWVPGGLLLGCSTIGRARPRTA